MSDKHEPTPVPWRVCGGYTPAFKAIAGPDGILIVHAFSDDRDCEVQAANAELIVTAVNSHAALVAAATDALDALDDRYDGTSDGRTLWMGRHIDALRKALMAGRAAKGATAL